MEGESHGLNCGGECWLIMLFCGGSAPGRRWEYKYRSAYKGFLGAKDGVGYEALLEGNSNQFVSHLLVQKSS